MSREFTTALLSQMMYSLQCQFLKKGFNDEDAENAAFETIDQLRKEFGGIPLCLPKDAALDRYLRNSQLYKKFTGANHEQLAMEFGLSVQQVYRIVDAIRGKHSQENYGEQPDMFGGKHA